MKLCLFSIVLSLLAPIVVAQPALYQEGILTIPQAAVINGDDSSYYGDIELSPDGNGKFQVTAAQSRNLVSIDEIEVLILESFPVQVHVAVSGNKSVPCVELEPAATARQGNEFTVVLAETSLGPAESCIAVLDPFQTSIPLDVLGLAAGTYGVSVNGIRAEFTLDMDNALQ